MTQPSPTLSCEFFPPVDTEASAALERTCEQLRALAPAYYSVTYGAGGSTRNRTFETVFALHQRAQVPAAPHLTCIASTRDSIRAILRHYQSHGIDRIVALRGDMPSGMHSAGELRHANELVAFIRETCGDHFHIEVAAYPEIHPQAPSAAQDLAYFRRKVEAGADAAITQYFFNADAYGRFLDECRSAGIGIPIVPGIMPIINFRQLARFSDQCGAEIPRWLRRRLEGFGDDRESLRAFGLEVISELCRKLLEGGAPGIHFYTMNRAEPTLAICRNLGLLRREAA
ncbi:MAG: methylenetetrahydrofolate reductase [NAD(P)H] [Candidatus Competibacterales bacterium]|nr:methylenetetrahydrofolate reductase [NAD(P)H] [Candidatus Competibacterales bacterium]